MKVAINGFGRIGRMIFRAGQKNEEIEFVAINDLTSTENLAYLLKYDSAHGKFDGYVNFDENNLIINGKKIPVYKEKDPEKLPWKKLKVDIVIESTGFFRTKELASKHLKAGAKKVLLSAPGKDIDLTIVKGVNEHWYDKEKHHIISNASCTTNSIAPVVKVLNDNYGIEKVFFITVHSYTADQRIVDAPHKDFRRGRSAAINIVPTTTGASKAVEEVIPELKNSIVGHAIRVPTVDGSITDLNIILKRKVTEEEIKTLLKNVSQYHLKGILEYTEEELVSTDIINNPHSTIIDGKMIRIKDNVIKILTWYDNEYGYSNRMIDLILHIGRQL